MIDSEFNQWAAVRARGKGAFLVKTALRRVLWFAIPLLLLLLLAHLQQGREALFSLANVSLLVTFAGVTVLIGIGDGVIHWAAREKEYARQGSFLAAPAFDANRLVAGGTARTVWREKCLQEDAENWVEDALVMEAKSFQTAHVRGLADLEQMCARFDPVFKRSLAKESHVLAVRAGVSEKAAFLALVSQLEN